MTPRFLNADWNHWPEGATVETIWADDAAIGFDGIELGVYDPAVELSDERIASYRALEERHGIGVVTALFSMPPARWPDGGLGDPAVAPRAIDLAIATAQRSRDAFGATLLGLWPGGDVLDRRSDPARAWPVLVDSFGAITEAVADLGMEVAVEYKPFELLANADAALRLCDAVGRDELGVILDTGHALWVGEDLPVAARVIGDRLKHLHLGDTPGPVEADLPPGWHHDFSAFFVALDAIGYDRTMTLDMYGAVEEGVIGAEDAARFGYETITSAMARARAGR